VSVRRIAIVNLTRLGDLLQTSPTVAGLRRQYPGAEITLVVEKNFAEVCEAIPGVDHVYRIDLDRLGHLLLAGGARVTEAYHLVRETVAELRAQRFDLALNFSSSRMSAVLLGLLRVADVRGWSMTADGHRAIESAWSRVFATLCLHRRVACFNLVDCYRGVAGCLDQPHTGLAFDVADEARRTIAERLQAHGVDDGARLVTLQLGASQPVRRWPLDSFAALAGELARDGCRIALVGGGGERELGQELTQACALGGTDVLDLCGRTTIQELAALLERASLLVTGDTGPMHLAAAVRTPILGLFFGPALPFDTGPYGEDHVLVHAAVGCAPCDHAVRCLDPFCRRTIEPGLVAALARARLGGDWSALASLGDAAPEPLRVYRTGFDEHGLFRCAQLGTRPPRREDELRTVLRATFLATLHGMPLPRPSRSAIDLAPFAALGELARLGEATAARLAQRAGDPRPGALDEIRRLGHEIEALDRAIAEHARVHPDVAVLAQGLAFDKEALPPGDVAALARALAGIYGALAQSAACMAWLLGGAPATGEVQGADLRQ
jgi:ADP-heptose:LPS heptosyltransferase